MDTDIRLGIYLWSKDSVSKIVFTPWASEGDADGWSDWADPLHREDIGKARVFLEKRELKGFYAGDMKIGAQVSDWGVHKDQIGDAVETDWLSSNKGDVLTHEMNASDKQNQVDPDSVRLNLKTQYQRPFIIDESSKTDFSDQSVWLSKGFAYNDGWRRNTNPRMMGDVNGDGMSD